MMLPLSHHLDVTSLKKIIINVVMMVPLSHHLDVSSVNNNNNNKWRYDATAITSFRCIQCI